jgi:hypothetical protein
MMITTNTPTSRTTIPRPSTRVKTVIVVAMNTTIIARQRHADLCVLQKQASGVEVAGGGYVW